MRRQFKDTIIALADADPRVAVILGDVAVFMFQEFQRRNPGRFYNMGICENTLISAAAGLASTGLLPFVHTIAPFLTERCLEQIKLDCSYNRFPVNIVTCGASFDYAWDGPTHHSYTDLAVLRLLPDMEVIQPGSRREADALVRKTYNSGNPTYIRLSDHPHDVETNLVFGKGTVLRHSPTADVTVMTAGPILANVMTACDGLDVNLAYFHTLKPIDREVVERFRHSRILVVHDAFGLREAINEVPGLRTWYHGIPDHYCTSYGTVHDIRTLIGLDVPGIRKAITALQETAAE
jgi:transketolase